MTTQPHPVLRHITLRHQIQSLRPPWCPSQAPKVTASRPPAAAPSCFLRSKSLRRHYPSNSLLRLTASHFLYRSALAASASCSPRSESLCIHCLWVAHSSQAATSRSQSPRCHCLWVTVASPPPPYTPLAVTDPLFFQSVSSRS